MSNKTVNAYKSTFQSIRSYCEKNEINYFSHNEAQVYTEIHRKRFTSGQISERHFRKLRRSAFLIADYIQNGILCWKSVTFPKKMLNEHFSSALTQFEEYLSPLIAPGTIRGVTSMIRQLLFFVEASKLDSIAELKADHVKLFLQSMVDKCKNSMGDLVWAMRKFILFLNETNLSAINADRYLLRPAPVKNKVLPCFTDQEIDAILNAVDTKTALGKRDYAIMKLAIDTGLRCVDILSMELKDINWHKWEISLIQSKTEEVIQLPLLVDTGNAVADYILHARPKTDSSHIFLRSVKPHTKLGNVGGGRNIISRYLDKAEIQHKAWDGKTFHAYRRTHGTWLTEAEVSIEYISELLGHVDIDSAKRYISQNTEKLRICCLDISEYATRKDGLYEL